MATYYSPSLSAGAHTQWQQQPNPSWQSGTAHQHNTHAQSQEQYPNGQENQPQQLYQAQMMMQQLQQYSHTPNANPTQQQPYATATPPQPVTESRKLPSPTSQDNALLAQIIHEQTKRGLTYKAALESLHGHNSIMAYAWKDYYLENKEFIDEMVFGLRGMPPPPYFKSQIPSPPGTDTPPMSEKTLAQTDSKFEPTADNDATRTNSPRSPRSSQTPSEPRPLKLNTDVEVNGKNMHPTPLSASRRGRVGRPSKSELIRRANDRRSGTPSSSRVRDVAADNAPRRTHNSLSSAPSNDLLNNVPPAVAIDPETGLPAAPSRSPSPPPVREQNSRVTEAETIFFYRRVAYDLKRDPNLTKNALCDILASKAPQRTTLSWKTIWAKHEKVADKMYLLTELYTEEDRQAAIRSWKGTGSTPSSTVVAPSRRVTNDTTYKESSTDDDGSASDASGSGVSTSASTSDDELSSLDESDDEPLGESGAPFNLADRRVIAKYITTRKNWYRGSRDWTELQKLYPETKKRAIFCYKEYYRRKQTEIDRIAKKYARKAKEEANLSAQRGRPSWAHSGNLKKRRLSGFPGGSETSEGKRAKVQDDE